MNLVHTSQETHYVSTTKLNRLVLFSVKSLFIVRTIRNIQIRSVGRMQSFYMLKQVAHIVATEL
jgi:hypothetical protein